MPRELSYADGGTSRSKSLIVGLALIAWHLIRAPIYLVLAILEPFVCIALSLLVLITLFTALVSRFLLHAPHFPFGFAMAFMFGCAILLALYHGLMALIAR